MRGLRRIDLGYFWIGFLMVLLVASVYYVSNMTVHHDERHPEFIDEMGEN